ncbi:MAG: proline dehydrogenase family protein [Deltaproteobacteria bacterium]|nr:proline dehydrogenase family protein [Deltaproteobacteria bacterium]
MLSARDLQQIELKTQEIGRMIFARIADQKPAIFRESWWSGRVMDWSMRSEQFKVEMFRFVDVLPCLRSSAEVARHLQEYLCRSQGDFPGFFQWGLRNLPSASLPAKVIARLMESNVRKLARRFIVGSNAAEAALSLKKNWKKGITFTADLLGEATVSEKEAEAYQQRYADLLRYTALKVQNWPLPAECPSCLSWKKAFESGESRVNVSVKLSALYSQFDPIDFNGSLEGVLKRLHPILKVAHETGAFINLDMEQYEWKDLALAIFRRIEEEGSSREKRCYGIAIQSYLKESERDVGELLAWAEKFQRPFAIRLVKGAYWDYELISSRQQGWPSPVWEHKRETDACFERLTRLLLSRYPLVRTAIGSHNVRSIAHATATAEFLGVPKEGFELQMLYGMAEPIKKTLVEMGYLVRDYTPIGELIPGMGYLVRRLLENTSNESFLRQRFVEHLDVEKLLQSPLPSGSRQSHDRVAL